MEQNLADSTALHVNDSGSLTVLVRNLRRSKLVQFAIIPAAFEVIFGAFDVLLGLIKNWQSLAHVPTTLILCFILFVSGVQQNHTAVNSSISAPQEANSIDTSAVLIQKAEMLPFVISQAAYKAVVEALHTLPYRIRNWQDLKKIFNILVHCLPVFVSFALENYETSLRARNLPVSTLLDADNLQSMQSAIFEVLDSLPHEIRHRLDMIHISTCLRHSFYLLATRAHEQRHDGTSVTPPATPPANFTCFFRRLREVFGHPFQLTTIFLDFCSLVHSFWDGNKRGPEVVLPISTLAKRPSSRLSRLLLEHSRDHSYYQFASEVASSRSSAPQIVAVIDLNKDSGSSREGGYSVAADVFGLTSLLLLFIFLNPLLRPSWMVCLFTLQAVLVTCGWSILFGDGTITLVQESKASHTSIPVCAMLLDNDLNVLLRGTQDLVDAITLGGFRLSYVTAGLLQSSMWKVIISSILEGLFQGLWYLMVLLPAWQFIPPSFTPYLSRWLVSWLVCNFVPALAFLSRCPNIVRHMKTNPEVIVTEFIIVCAMCAPLYVAWFAYVHDYSTFHELQILLDMVRALSVPFIFSISPHDHPIRTAKFLDVLGNPPVRKWRFKTPAAAATFQCLVLCHDIRRPVKTIDVRGVLDALIPDQRDVWKAWKGRVADRIANEVDVIFTPTIPTFSDAKRQKLLKEYLVEAQHAYEIYRDAYPDESLAQAL